MFQIKANYWLWVDQIHQGHRTNWPSGSGSISFQYSTEEDNHHTSVRLGTLALYFLCYLIKEAAGQEAKSKLTTGRAASSCLDGPQQLTHPIPYLIPYFKLHSHCKAVFYATIYTRQPP